MKHYLILYPDLNSIRRQILLGLVQPNWLGSRLSHHCFNKRSETILNVKKKKERRRGFGCKEEKIENRVGGGGGGRVSCKREKIVNRVGGGGK